MRERLSRLPVLCEELLAIYPRNEIEERAEILLADLPYAAVMMLAIRVRVVRDVIAALPVGFSRWT